MVDVRSTKRSPKNRTTETDFRWGGVVIDKPNEEANFRVEFTVENYSDEERWDVFCREEGGESPYVKSLPRSKMPWTSTTSKPLGVILLF